MKKRLLNKKGFSIVECIIAIVVICIISGSAIAIYSLSSNSSSNRWDSYHTVVVANNALNIFKSSEDSDGFTADLTRLLGTSSALASNTSDSITISGRDSYTEYDVSKQMVSTNFGTLRVYKDGYVKLFSSKIGNQDTSTQELLKINYKDNSNYSSDTNELNAQDTIFDQKYEKSVVEYNSITVTAANKEEDTVSSKCLVRDGIKPVTRSFKYTSSINENTVITITNSTVKISYKINANSYWEKDAENYKDYITGKKISTLPAPLSALKSSIKNVLANNYEDLEQTYTTTELEKYLLSQGWYLSFDANSMDKTGDGFTGYIYFSVNDANSSSLTPVTNSEGKNLYIRVHYNSQNLIRSWSSSDASFTIDNIMCTYTTASSIQDAKSKEYSQFNEVFGTNLDYNFKWSGIPCYVNDLESTMVTSSPYFDHVVTKVSCDSNKGQSLYFDYTIKDCYLSNLAYVITRNYNGTNSLEFYTSQDLLIYKYNGTEAQVNSLLETVRNTFGFSKDDDVVSYAVNSQGEALYDDNGVQIVEYTIHRKMSKPISIKSIKFEPNTINKEFDGEIGFYDESGNKVFWFNYSDESTFYSDVNSVRNAGNQFSSYYIMENSSEGILQQTDSSGVIIQRLNNQFQVNCGDTIVFIANTTNIDADPNIIDLKKQETVKEMTTEIVNGAVKQCYTYTRGKHSLFIIATFSEVSYDQSVEPHIKIWTLDTDELPTERQIKKLVDSDDWADLENKLGDPYITYKKG